jgi:glycosyltransferase involved in cell wall biosynthesis
MTASTKVRKILFVILSYSPDIGAGATRSTRKLAETLARRGHEVHVAELVPPGDPAARTRRVVEGVTVHSLPLRNLYWAFDMQKRPGWKRKLWHLLDIANPLAAWDIRNLMRKIKPEIVNTSVITGFSTGIWYPIKANGAKLIHTLRDYYLMCPQAGMYRDNKNCEGICKSCQPFFTARKSMSGEVDLFLSNSAFVTARHTANGFFTPETKCPTQWNINELKGDGQPRTRPPVLRFGFAGRLTAPKGIEVLLQAAMGLKDREGWELHIAGKGDETYVNGLKQRFGHLPQVKFLGWMQPQDFYPHIDVLVCPSTYHEPLPRVVYEGYAFGLPTLSAATGGTPEVVEEGATGFLYPAEEVSQLQERMERFLAQTPEEYTAMSAHALKKAEMFTPDAVAALFEQRMDEVLAG